jgi:hypothetical protein
MHKLEDLVEMLDHALNTKTKRHITGGVLLSISLLFGGLAVTIMTLKTEDIEREHYLE